MFNSRKLSVLSLALALVGLGAVVPSAPASAQSIFASPYAAHAAGLSYQNGGTQQARSVQSADDTTTDPGTGGGTTSTDPYAAIFSQIQTATSGLLSGPGALAFGVLILGLGFGVAWRLTTKGVKSIAK